MNAMLSEDGKIVLPAELRKDAQLRPGDTLDIQLYKGTILLRKHQPLTPEQCAALLERSRSQSEPAAGDDTVVEEVIREVRASRRGPSSPTPISLPAPPTCRGKPPALLQALAVCDVR